MKFLFVDEFKEEKKNHKFYGLSAVLIDNSSYARFKNGFYKKLKKLGWDEKVEIKGCYSFSAKKGDSNIQVEDRLKFVEELFELSKSGSTKYASAKVFYSLDIFSKSSQESEMYSDLLQRILNKLPKGSTSGNKNGKNNIVIFLDNNQVLNIDNISEQSENTLKTRNLYLIERCIDICSSNKTPGIIFADHVAYFLHNYIKTSDFNDKNKERIKFLIDKFSKNDLNDKEQEEFNRFMVSSKKEQKSIDLLKALKTMIYVK